MGNVLFPDSGEDRQKTKLTSDQLNSLVSRMKTDQEALERSVKTQISNMRELYKAKDYFTEILKEAENSKFHAKSRVSDQQKEISELKSDINRLQRQIEEMDFKNNALKKEIEQIKHEHSFEVDRMKTVIDDLNHQLFEFKSKKSMEVFVYAAAMNEKISSSVENEMREILTNHMECTRGITIKINILTDPNNAPPNKPLLILCINASRLGTDVGQALHNVKCSKCVTVAVIHHKEIHALPPQASEKLLLGEKYRQLYSIVDIAFLTNRGMYPCSMNENTIERLTEFICSFDV